MKFRSENEYAAMCDDMLLTLVNEFRCMKRAVRKARKGKVSLSPGNSNTGNLGAGRAAGQDAASSHCGNCEISRESMHV